MTDVFLYIREQCSSLSQIRQTMYRLLCSNITDVKCDGLGVKTGTQEDKPYFCLNAVRSCRLQAPGRTWPSIPERQCRTTQCSRTYAFPTINRQNLDIMHLSSKSREMNPIGHIWRQLFSVVT